MNISFRAFIFAVAAFGTVFLQGCKGRAAEQFLVAAGVLNSSEGTVAIASATDGEEDVTDANIGVNNTILAYGLPINFETDDGLVIDLIAPIYYAEMNDISEGDELNFRARDKFNAVVYKRDGVTMPAQITLTAPTSGQTFGVDEDIAMNWSDARDAEGYLASYVELGAFDGDVSEDGVDAVEYDEEDPGLFTEYVSAGEFDPIGTQQVTVPAANTVAGDALFGVYALAGDVDIFTDAEAAAGSFFLVGTLDEVEGVIEDAATAAAVTGLQGLSIVKEYSKKVQGLRFTVRESNPQQITQSGTITVGFKMRRFKVSVAFVKAYDINGNEYFSWIKKRIYKSKKKKYYPAFSASPGTTVVFGTHDASYRGGTYSF